MGGELTTSGEVKAMNNPVPYCQICQLHGHPTTACPCAEEVELYPNGKLKRVKFKSGRAAQGDILGNVKTVIDIGGEELRKSC